MKLLAAYLLAQLGGNDSPSASDVSKILSAVGIDADEEQLEKLISDLSGKDINEVIAEGTGKLASMPAAGAVAAAPAGAAAAAGGAAKEEKKEEKKEEEEESDEDMGFGLFD